MNTKRMIFSLALLAALTGMTGCKSKESQSANDGIVPALPPEQEMDSEIIADPETEQTATEEAETAGLTTMVLIPSVEPEQLRNVMPNSWRKLERLTETEEEEFIKNNLSLLLMIEKGNQQNKPNFDQHGYFGYFSLYKQIIGTDIFYRVIATENNKPDFVSAPLLFSQDTIHEGTILFSSYYINQGATQYGYRGVIQSVDIISDNEGAKGILVTDVSIRNVNNTDLHDWFKYSPRRNGQLYGGVESNYYGMSDLPREAIYPSVNITASDCLVDADSPLRYSLQNAFDGDPATSYVENTEDDLMEFRIDFPSGKVVSKIAVTNGYAQNMDLYLANNRAKSIIFWSHNPFQRLDMPLMDNELTQQIFETSFPQNAFTYGMEVESFYSGLQYNDTSLAEINFKDENGWLFGDIDE